MVFVIFLCWATSTFVDTMNNNFLMACDHLRLPADLNLEHTVYILWTSTPSLLFKANYNFTNMVRYKPYSTLCRRFIHRQMLFYISECSQYQYCRKWFISNTCIWFLFQLKILRRAIQTPKIIVTHVNITEKPSCSTY